MRSKSLGLTVPKSISELPSFEVALSRVLAEQESVDDLVAALTIAGKVTLDYLPSEDPAPTQLARTWLRSAIHKTNETRPLLNASPDLEIQAQKIFLGLSASIRSDIDFWNGSKEAGRDVFDFLRSRPRAAGLMRELGRAAKSLRGTDVLVLADEELIEKLISFDETLTKRGHRSHPVVPSWLHITREQILGWANSPEADQDLPVLVRQLVEETGAGIEVSHFPSEGAISSGGWDGFVRAVGTDIHVPAGASGWELSKSKGSQEKALADYEQRSRTQQQVPRDEITYVQVICRPWTKAAEFVRDKSKDRIWKEVRAYNVDDLVQWLDRAPATSLWFLERTGHPVAGMSSLSYFWNAWLASTDPPLDANIVLAGRNAAVKALKDRLSQPGITTIGGDVRLEEIQAFVAAVFDQTSDEESVDLPLLVSEQAITQQLLSRPGSLTILVGSPNQLHGFANLEGHRILVPVPTFSDADIVIPPVSSHEVRDQLRALGKEIREATAQGELARRSLLALRRSLAKNANLHRPSWSYPGADSLRRRVLLMNKWNRRATGDREVLSQLVGLEPDAIEDMLKELAAALDDPMVGLVDERWHVIAPKDAWMLLGSQITSEDIELLQAAVNKVILEPEPAANGEGGEVNPFSRREGRKHSADLRDGLARTLALMGALNLPLDQGLTTTGLAVEQIVRDLFDVANRDEASTTWLLLAPLLPLLAEAAPAVFLKALYQGLNEHEPLQVTIFQDRSRDSLGFGQSAPHTHFLWALEIVAWAPEHLDEAASLLARLTELDPGGHLANRPKRSLASVFLPWHPNTSASSELRLATLDRLRRRHPDVAWELMLSMLPDPMGMQLVQGPVFRDWKEAEPVVTYADYGRVIEHTSRALLVDAIDNPSRLIDLVNQLPDLPRQHREDFRSLLAEHLPRLTSDNRKLVWRSLRSLIAKHREYSDATWALSVEELHDLEDLLVEFSPTRAIDRNAWLFAEGMISLGDQSKRSDYRGYEEALEQRRIQAVREIEAEEGLQALMEFARTTPVPGYIGSALASALDKAPDQEMLPLLSSEDEALIDLAFAYFSRRFSVEGWDWLDGYMKEHVLHPSVAGRLLRSTRQPEEAGRRADLAGEDVAKDFWKGFNYFGLGQDYTQGAVVARRLMSVGRNAAALDMLALYSRKADLSDPAFVDLIADAFDALKSQPDDDEISKLRDFELQTLFAILSQHSDRIGTDRVAAIEWYFMPALGFDPQPPTLHKLLAKKPEFFVEIISLVFKPVAVSIENSLKPDRRTAENAFKLLSSWNICPGTDENGNIDFDDLLSWVKEARHLLEEGGRLDIGDEQIGQALGSAPPGRDDIWPAEEVRDLLEEGFSSRIDRGLEIRMLNNRGVTVRSPDEGGKQELDLAASHRKNAIALMTKWPHMANIYRRLAENYERDARREEAEAERRRRGID